MTHLPLGGKWSRRQDACMRNLHSALRVGFPYVTSVFRIRTADRDMGIRALVGREVYQYQQETTRVSGRQASCDS
jgi:hypothetical protein